MAEHRSGEDRVFFVDVDASMSYRMSMDELFPDGWDESAPPSAQDVIDAMKSQGSKEHVIYEWSLLDLNEAVVTVTDPTERPGTPERYATW